jgi:hypothetical protein
MVEKGTGNGPDPEPPPAKAGAAKSDDAPPDAVLSLAETWAERASWAEAGRPDRWVSVAFALGWQMAEVYRPARRRRSSPADDDDDLPGISRLTVGELEEMGLDQIQAGITKLRESIMCAGLRLPNAQRLEHHLGSIGEPDKRKEAIREFHVDLLSTLTAADYRLGKAYGLGRALADTTRHPPDYHRELGAFRIATLADWTRQLATALPRHAAQPVASSMEAWSRSVNGAGADNQAAPRQLGAQGRLWRSLLSGEKQATDVLETSDYVRAAERSLQRSGALGLRFVRHYWWLVGIVVALFVVGVVVIATASGAPGIVAGAAPIVASFGLSWKGIGTSLGTTTARLEEPLWQAELDRVIYERITPQEIINSQGAVVAGLDEPSLAIGASESDTQRTQPSDT